MSDVVSPEKRPVVSKALEKLIEDALDASHVHEMLVVEEAPRWRLDESRVKSRTARDNLLRAIETLEQDKARLDWVELQTNGYYWCARQSKSARGFRLHNTIFAPSSPTAREAIDEAISPSHSLGDTPV